MQKEKEKQKNKKNYNWIFQIIVYGAIIGFFALVVYMMYINGQEIKCLRPYAESYCKSQNHSYIEHNLVYMTCSKETYDTRLVGDSQVVQYWFSSGEKDICGVGK
jgi:hypothetical protein